MQVNTTIWGAPETWVSATAINGAASGEIKKSAAATDTYKENYTLGTLPLNDIDYSPAFYGIGKDSILCNPQYISPYADGGDLTKPKIDVRPVLENKKDRSCMFNASQTSGFLPRYSGRFAPDVTAAPNDNNANCQIVLDFNYQKVFLIPQVYYVADNFHNGATTVYRWGLYEYFSTFDEETYPPRVVGIGYRMYFGDAGSRTLGNSGMRTYTIFDDIKGYEGTYNNVPFYALYGMKTGFCTSVSVDSNNYSKVQVYRDQRVTRNATVGTADTGFRFKYCKSNTTEMSWYFYEPDNPLWSVDIEEVVSGTTYWNPYPYIKVTAANKNEVYDYLLKQFAFIGLPFLYGTTFDNYNVALGSPNYALPVFDEYGVTTGEFKTGDDARLLPNSLWTDSRSSGYNPNRPREESNDYGDTTNQGSARGLLPAGVNIYLMSRSDYNIFMGELNSYYQGSSPDDWTLDFQGVNPSDYILAAYYTPYNFLKSDTKSAVKIGPLTLTTTAYELSEGSPPDDPNKWKTFSYGTRTVTPAFYDFRDYEPFTTVELYLPLAGTVQLETAYVMNHDITVNYYFDLMSMSGVACVYRDNMLYKTNDFKLGCQVPVLSQNMGDIQNQIMSLDTARKQNNIRLTAATTATTGSAIKALSGKASDVSNLAGGAGLLQIASGVINADKIDYDMTHSPASVSVTGAAEPLNNYSVGQLKPKLIIKRPLMLPDKNDGIYSHTVGNACLINTTIGAMSGLIVCSNSDLTGISATASELQMIQTALNGGIYV